MKYTLQTRITDTLNGAISAGASSLTLTSGNFGTPTGKQIITIDYDVASKAADFLCTIANTAVTSMTLLNGPDTSHSSGCNIAMNLVDEHYGLLADAIDNGWVEESVNETWVYASASTFTVANIDVTAKYRVGVKLRFKQGGGYKYATVASSAFSTNTTVTIFVNTDYTIANSAITSNAYSYAETPQGFPDSFTWSGTLAGFSGTPTQANYYSVKGKYIEMYFDIQGTSNGTSFTCTVPAAAKRTQQFANGRYVDNGSFGGGSPLISTTAASATVTFNTSLAGGTWTGSAGKQLQGCLRYETNV